MSRVYASGAFDEAGSATLRFLQEAARLGPLTLLLWPDAAIASPRMGLAERLYYFGALSYVDRVVALEGRHGPGGLDPDRLPIEIGAEPAVWAVCQGLGGVAAAPSAAKLAWCRSSGVELREIPRAALAGFPYEAPPLDAPLAPGLKRVVATGCYDWLHTGHLRFFEEASAYGELNIVIGSDANVRLLKGEGHPLFSQEERSYLVGSFRSVARCLVSTGEGWLDAEPEIRALGAQRYVVNEDGDKPEKRRYCEENGIEYIVLKRTPKEGLPRRSSTDLRGF
jgi:cytidyltransferase-like protein